MPNQTMDNLQLNIQLHTLYGTTSMIHESSRYRYNVLNRIQEELKAFNRNIENANDDGLINSNELTKINEFMDAFADKISLFDNYYGEAVTYSKKYEESAANIYKDIMYKEVVYDDKSIHRLVEYFDNVISQMYDKVLSQEFIDHDSFVNELEEYINGLRNEDNRLKNAIVQFSNNISNELIVIIQQNGVIASSIELIKTVRDEVE